MLGHSSVIGFTNNHLSQCQRYKRLTWCIVDRVNNVPILCVEFYERTEQVSSSSKGWFFHSDVCRLKSRMFRELCSKRGKGKSFPVHVMKAYRGRRGISPLILNLSARWKWMFKFTSRPLYFRQRTPVPILYVS